MFLFLMQILSSVKMQWNAIMQILLLLLLLLWVTVVTFLLPWITVLPITILLPVFKWNTIIVLRMVAVTRTLSPLLCMAPPPIHITHIVYPILLILKPVFLMTKPTLIKPTLTKPTLTKLGRQILLTPIMKCQPKPVNLTVKKTSPLTSQTPISQELGTFQTVSLRMWDVNSHRICIQTLLYRHKKHTPPTLHQHIPNLQFQAYLAILNYLYHWNNFEHHHNHPDVQRARKTRLWCQS